MLGSEIVEFAIIASLLFALVFGIISYGIMLYDLSVITNAARVGARAGIVYAASGSALPYTGCASATNPYITIATMTTPGTNAPLTAQCAANNALSATPLISFATATPTINSPDPNVAACASSTINQCALTVTITYLYTGIYKFPPRTLTATTTMNYE